MVPVSVQVTPPTAAGRLLLRAEVGRLRARESRRVFDPSVHVGVLGGDRTGVPLRAADRSQVDVALRTDVVSRLVEGSPSQWHTAWLVRPGTPDQHDMDLQWLAAAWTAFGMHARRLDGCFVVTRTGWCDVVTDERQVWTRLRI